MADGRKGPPEGGGRHSCGTGWSDPNEKKRGECVVYHVLRDPWAVGGFAGERGLGEIEGVVCVLTRLAETPLTYG